MVCDLVDDIRDAMVEYQVSINIEHMRDDSFMQPAGRAAEGNLQAEL